MVMSRSNCGISASCAGSYFWCSASIILFSRITFPWDNDRSNPDKRKTHSNFINTLNYLLMDQFLLCNYSEPLKTSWKYTSVKVIHLPEALTASHMSGRRPACHWNRRWTSWRCGGHYCRCRRSPFPRDFLNSSRGQTTLTLMLISNLMWPKYTELV